MLQQIENSDTSNPLHRSQYHNTGTSVPLMHITSLEHDQSQNAHKHKTLPHLPSHRFQYTVWHDLRGTQVKGDQLKAPRVRDGPKSKEETFYELAHNSGELIHHDRVGRERTTYRDQQENWETCLKANLSFQRLDQDYQVKNFVRILHRLKSAEVITLMDNCLHDLRGLKFPRCRVANFSKNYFASFKMLPSMPQLKHLILPFNQIKDLSGLDRYPGLEYLELTGNGIYYSRTYRYRVFKVLSNLKVLDKTLKMESDIQPPTENYTPDQGSTCVVM